RVFLDDGGQLVAPRFAQLLGVAQALDRARRIQDHGGRVHRAGQRPASRLVDAADDVIERERAVLGLEARVKFEFLLSHLFLPMTCSTASALSRALSRSRLWWMSVKRCTRRTRLASSVSWNQTASASASGVTACCSSSGTTNARDRMFGSPIHGM